MQTLKYMLKNNITTRLLHYKFATLLIIYWCYVTILFYLFLYKGGSHASDMYVS